MKSPINPKLVKAGDKILVAFSGGADSVVLLHSLSRVEGVELTACHLNHMIRGTEADRDEQFCKDFCKTLGVPIVTERQDCLAFAKQKGLSAEEAGRRLRYDFFYRVKNQCSADKIATAHTASDNAETIIFRLTKGSGIKGLCGIPQSRGEIIRPILEYTRTDIEEYCRENSLFYMTDSTNTDVSYARNRIRHTVIPQLKEINPAVEKTLMNTVKLLSCEEDFLHTASEEAYRCAEVCKNGLSRDELLKLHTAVCRRVIAAFLEKNGASVSLERVLEIEKILSCRSGKISIDNKSELVLRKGILRLESRNIACKGYSACLDRDEIYIENIGSFKKIICDKYEIEKLKKVYKNLLYIVLDYDKIKRITVRNRREGDKISLSGRGVTKTLKKLFNEMSLSAEERARTPVLADETGVAGVFGVGADRRAEADGNSEKYMLVIYNDEKGDKQ